MINSYLWINFLFFLNTFTIFITNGFLIFVFFTVWRNEIESEQIPHFLYSPFVLSILYNYIDLSDYVVHCKAKTIALAPAVIIDAGRGKRRLAAARSSNTSTYDTLSQSFDPTVEQ